MVVFLAFIILLSVVVFVHELGHFILARMNGVRVEAFSICMGRKLFGWKDRRGTEWRVGLFPIGGYVKMLGQSDLPESAAAKAAMIRRLSAKDRAAHFELKKKCQRAAIIIAGPAFNYLFGILVFFMLFWAVGRPNTPAYINSVAEGSPAAAAGLRSRDRLLEVDGMKVSRVRDVSRMINAKGGSGAVSIKVERGGREFAVSVVPEVEGGKSVIGITYGVHFVDYSRLGAVESMRAALSETWDITAGTGRALAGIVTGTQSSRDLGGIISIAKVSGDALSQGVYSFLYLIAFISISLGLFNLLPVPVLDGGYIFIYLLEWIVRRDLSEKFKERMFAVGFALVVLLVLFATYNDIVRLLGR
jgi:regulator of sigma E protease